MLMRVELRRFTYAQSQLQCRDWVFSAVELDEGMKRLHDRSVRIDSGRTGAGQARTSEAGATVEDLFHRLSGQLKRYGVGLGFPPEEAEEAVQEGFLRLQGAFNRQETVHNPGAFLHTVVRHVLIDSARLNVRFAFYDGQATADCGQNGRAGGADTEDLLRLAGALLTPRENEVFTRRWAGLSYREISAELGISRGTVGALVSRAIGKVRRCARHSG